MRKTAFILGLCALLSLSACGDASPETPTPEPAASATISEEETNYISALALLEAGKYEEAAEAFQALEGYKDSSEQLEACQAGILKQAYTAAEALLDSGSYEEAAEAFLALAEYNDAEERARHILAEHPEATPIGETLLFGEYMQDYSEGKRPIEWIVLDKDGTKVLVISKYALDRVQVNEVFQEVTWSSCTMRTWMNGAFINEAFSAEEQARIVTTTVPADYNPEYSTDPGIDTQDKIFALSVPEAERYFATNNDRLCGITDYALSQGGYSSGGLTTWWLRTPGSESFDAAVVDDDGSIFYEGTCVHGFNITARPAMWIDFGV